MLEEIKRIYEDSASLYVNDWKSMNKNDLIRSAIENVHTSHFDSYISAIMLRYWGKMTAYYHKCKLVATPEDVHMWMTQAVMYAVDNHPWDDPKSSIYKDKNGPDKVINRVFESRRLTFYQQLNRYNRKINSVILSLESLTEDMLDTYTPMCEDEHTFIMDDLIIRAFKEKDYFFAFLVDAIVTEGYRVGGKNKKLVTHLRNLEKHCDIFAGRYDLNINAVQRATTYITRLNRSTIGYKIITTLNDIKRKLEREQSGVESTNNCTIELHHPNAIVEYYYTKLWE
jgi:hypothetical protein